MRKLPPGEALRRHKERNALQSARLKQERIDRMLSEGKNPYKPTSEQKKAKMREYQKTSRLRIKEATEAGRLERKAAKAILVAERREAAKVKKLEAQRAKRAAARVGKPDKRRKESRVVTHWKQLLPAKPTPSCAPAPKAAKTTLPKSYSRKAKPVPKENPMIIPVTPTDKIKVRLSPRLEIFTSPGYDIEVLRSKYGIK